jgi:hypothetical protein
MSDLPSVVGLLSGKYIVRAGRCNGSTAVLSFLSFRYSHTSLALASPLQDIVSFIPPEVVFAFQFELTFILYSGPKITLVVSVFACRWLLLAAV